MSRAAESNVALAEESISLLGGEPFEIVQRLLARSPAALGMGINVCKAGPGQVELSLVVLESMVNGVGVCQGGYLFALADIAAAYSCLTRGAKAFTHTANISFIKSAYRGEHLLARAHEVSRAGRSSVYDVVISNESGQTIVLWRGTFRSMNPEKLEESL